MKTLYTLLFLVACAYSASAQQVEQQLPKQFPEIKEFKPELQYFDSATNETSSSDIPKITASREKELMQQNTGMPIKKPDSEVHFHILAAKPEADILYHLQIKKP